MALEIELKYRFSNKQDFEMFLKSFPGQHRIENQVNHFWDTADFQFQKQHIFLRFRQSDQAWTFTRKSKPDDSTRSSDRISIHHEFEQKLTEGSLASQRAFLQKLMPGEMLEYKGCFKNTRTHVPYSFGEILLDLEFDQTDFGIRTDYELEIELPENLDPKQVDAVFLKQFQKINLTVGPSSGKAERLFNLDSKPDPDHRE